ncbi:iron-siderophore ABC transporter substrate-binding protein [Streptomyces sp. 8L]|uniref:iron-siderophore ABC transporter substrate-binding protein n=1 Tax=Streptomyces sp. 8L TaxID=2877242 RepID=UPI001CD3D7B7|nr:iron-siderophore ABC transporter substrate-binding protein [Streptomyces sp. 8L]MCA1219447.1 iron-siderophore ABC transporter substrate-binding protein [Streptomyces sp. 8L]
MLPSARLLRGSAGRWTVAALVSAALITPLAAGCSSPSDGSDSSAAKTGSSSSSGSFPATIPTKFGDVTVDKKPTRVLALGWGDAETSLALGTQPVGASDWLAFGGNGVGPWAKGLYKKKPEIIGTLELNYEKIAALRPDLILDTKSSGDSKRYKTLSKIAPTVDVPKDGDAYKTSWQEQIQMIAAALGKKEEGGKLIAGVDKKFAEATKEHPEFKGKTISVGALSGDGYGAYVRGDSRISFAQELGFKNNPEVDAKAKGNFFINVSRENLNLLDADLVVMSPIGVSSKKISGDKLFQAIPAVRKGHSVVLDNQDISQAFATDSALSIGYAIDKTVPLFAKALRD